MSNYTNTLELCGLHFSHSTLPFMCKSTAVDKHLLSTMIYWPLITTSETWKVVASSSAAYESVRELCEGAGMLSHRVYARLQHFLGDIYSTMKETNVSASHENNRAVRKRRDLWSATQTNRSSGRHCTSSSSKYGLKPHIVLDHEGYSNGKHTINGKQFILMLIIYIS